MMFFTPWGFGIIAFLCVLAIVYAIFAELSAKTPVYVLLPHHEARLIELDRKAVETAYSQQVINLFLQWMKDDTQQPERALRGLQQAQSAYGRAMQSIEVREKAK